MNGDSIGNIDDYENNSLRIDGNNDNYKSDGSQKTQCIVVGGKFLSWMSNIKKDVWTYKGIFNDKTATRLETFVLNIDEWIDNCTTDVTCNWNLSKCDDTETLIVFNKTLYNNHLKFENTTDDQYHFISQMLYMCDGQETTIHETGHGKREQEHFPYCETPRSIGEMGFLIQCLLHIFGLNYLDGKKFRGPIVAKFEYPKRCDETNFFQRKDDPVAQNLQRLQQIKKEKQREKKVPIITIKSIISEYLSLFELCANDNSNYNPQINDNPLLGNNDNVKIVFHNDLANDLDNDVNKDCGVNDDDDEEKEKEKEKFRERQRKAMQNSDLQSNIQENKEKSENLNQSNNENKNKNTNKSNTDENMMDTIVNPKPTIQDFEFNLQMVYCNRNSLHRKWRELIKNFKDIDEYEYSTDGDEKGYGSSSSISWSMREIEPSDMACTDRYYEQE